MLLHGSGATRRFAQTVAYGSLTLLAWVHANGCAVCFVSRRLARCACNASKTMGSELKPRVRLKNAWRHSSIGQSHPRQRRQRYIRSVGRSVSRSSIHTRFVVLRSDRGHIIFPKHHFNDSLLHRKITSSNVTRSNRHIVECHSVKSSYCRIVKLPELYNVECYFLEFSLSRVILSNIYLAERHFSESSFSGTTFFRNFI